jgi:hypothetical protein
MRKCVVTILTISFIFLFTSIAEGRDKRWMGTNKKGHFTSSRHTSKRNSPRYKTNFKPYKNIYWENGTEKKYNLGRFKAKRIR